MLPRSLREVTRLEPHLIRFGSGTSKGQSRRETANGREWTQISGGAETISLNFSTDLLKAFRPAAFFIRVPSRSFAVPLHRIRPHRICRLPGRKPHPTLRPRDAK